MKIEIHSPASPAEDMTIYCEGKRLTQPTNGIYSHYWDESDLSKLLSEKQMKELQEGKFIFDVPTWKIRLLQHKRPAKDNTQLNFISQWY